MRLSQFKARSTQRGFSLVELAIVVAVTGLLFGGLWRLMASGNAQLREQTAADQITQIISATRNFLASQGGQAVITALAPAPNGVVQLPLPATLANAAGSAGCAAALDGVLANSGTFCNFLPLGFWTGVTNSYGQSYQVYVRKDNTPINTAAQTYDFVVLTTGGDVIPETSGSRIAANIGANGGFVFSNNTCGVPANFACGSFNSFNLNLTAAGPFGILGAISPGSGHIVTLNSSTLSNAASAQWLARIGMAGDFGVNTPPIFNTMTVPLHMQTGGAAAINMRGNFINMNAGTGGPGGGIISLEEGTINGPGQINIDNSGILTSAITISQSGAGNLSSSVSISNTVQASTALDINAINNGCDPQAAPLTCNLGLNVDGSANISAFLNANQMRAGTFIYTSDMRLKRDIAKIPNALERLTQLNGYHFNWKKDGRGDLGLMAQEVRQVFPELVHDSAVGGHLGVEYGNLVAPMIEAIKELKVQNAAMAHEIKRQQAEIDGLRRAK